MSGLPSLEELHIHVQSGQLSELITCIPFISLPIYHYGSIFVLHMIHDNTSIVQSGNP